MVHEGAQILVAKRAFLECVAAIVMARHDGHVLQVAFAAFIAHRAVVGMVGHQAFNDGRPGIRPPPDPRIEMRVPSAAGVMQAMTSLPCVSASSLNCLTAHWRQAPTEPSAGCQQKYGRLNA